MEEKDRVRPVVVPSVLRRWSLVERVEAAAVAGDLHQRVASGQMDTCDCEQGAKEISKDWSVF